MSCVMRLVSGVTCQVSHVRCLVLHVIFVYKVIKLVYGKSVINGAYPFSLSLFVLVVLAFLLLKFQVKY